MVVVSVSCLPRGGIFRDSMPGGRMRDMHDARQRAALLAGDEVLREQYKEMVQGNVLSEEVRQGGGRMSTLDWVSRFKGVFMSGSAPQWTLTIYVSPVCRPHFRTPKY